MTFIIFEKNNGMILFEEEGNLHKFTRLLSGIDYSSLFVLTDKNTSVNCSPVLHDTNVNFLEITVEDGEHNKTWDNVAAITSELMQHRADRQSLLINLGGGMITDLGGFVASVFKRGIRFIHIPTSLLAMVDAAIGGKNGINFNGIKNQLGCIRQPEAVYINPIFLTTLPEKEHFSGLAEMLKHGLIADYAYFESLASYPDINLFEAIKRSVEIKQRIIRQDPHEKGLRKILNFGHTVGHALEAFYQDRGLPVTHGHAVALGMIAELYLSSEITGLEKKFLNQASEVLHKFYKVPHLKPGLDELAPYLVQDKKNLNGRLLAVLLKSPSEPLTDIPVPADVLKQSLDYLFVE